MVRSKQTFKYDASWRNCVKPKRFRLVRTSGRACVEVVFAYPHFKSLGEGLNYIKTVLGGAPDYGIVDDKT